MTNSIFWSIVLSVSLSQLSATAGESKATKAQRMDMVKKEYQSGCINGETYISADSCTTRKAAIEQYEAETAKNTSSNSQSNSNTNTSNASNSNSNSAADSSTNTTNNGQPSSTSNTGSNSTQTSNITTDTEGTRTQIHIDKDDNAIVSKQYKDGSASVEKISPTGEILDKEFAAAGENKGALNSKAKELGVDPPDKMQSSANQDKSVPTSEQAKSEFDKNKQDVNKAAKELPSDAKDQGKKVADENQKSNPDDKQQARLKKEAEENKSLTQELNQLKTQVQNAKTNALNEANAKCASPEVEYNTVLMQECTNQALLQAQIDCVDKNITIIEKAKASLDPQKESCSQTSAQAEQLCSLIRSDKAQMVQQLMSIGATVLSSVTAASEGCGTTSNLAKVAQGGMILAQMACTAVKFRCDFSCASAEKLMKEMRTGAEALMKCGLDKLQATQNSGVVLAQSTTRLSQRLAKELQTDNSVPAAIKQCEKHSVDIATMGIQVLGFAKASADATACKEQLASGNGGGKSSSSVTGAKMTTVEYCGIPSNATSITCKCIANPNAEGCLGSIAKQGIQHGRINTGSGAAGFAGTGSRTGSTGLIASDTQSKKPNGEKPTSGLSAAAREALGLNNNAASTNSMNSGGSSPSGGNTQNGNSASDVSIPKKSFGFFSSLSNAVSNSFGGNKNAATPNSKAFNEKVTQQAIKRKIASDEARAQISPASGMSNFEKINKRYRSKFSSLEE